MKNLINIVWSIAVVALISGCSSMSGLGGSSQFSCKAPDGVKCESMTGVYHNAVADNLPSQRPSRLQKKGAGSSEGLVKTAAPYRDPLAAPIAPPQEVLNSPIRSAAKTLRVWLAPYQDQDGDLHDARYVYVLATEGGWLVDHETPLKRRSVQTKPRPPASKAENVDSKLPAAPSVSTASKLRPLPPAPTVKPIPGNAGNVTTFPVEPGFFGQRGTGNAATATLDLKEPVSRLSTVPVSPKGEPSAQ